MLIQIISRRWASHFVGLTVLILAPGSSAQELSEEGRNKKATHGYLFDTFAQGRKSVYTGSGRDRGLKELAVLTETKDAVDTTDGQTFRANENPLLDE